MGHMLVGSFPDLTVMDDELPADGLDASKVT